MTEKFIYVTYIRTTAEKLWDALTKPEFTREYWFGSWQDCQWEPDAAWKLRFDDGTLTDSGTNTTHTVSGNLIRLVTIMAADTAP